MTTYTPLPGDPGTVRTRAQALVDAAAAMGSAASELDNITNYSADTSGAVQALRQRVGDLAKMVRKAETRYSGAGQALLTYATALEAAQQNANSAISAHNQMGGDVAAAQSKADSTRYNPLDLNTTPQQVTDHQHATDHLSHLQAVDNVNATDYNNAVNDLRTAAYLAKHAIEAANDHSDLDNSWWDDVTSFVSDIVNWSGWKEVLAIVKDIADIVATIATVVAIVLAAASVVFPVLAPFAAAAFLVSKVASLVSLGVTVIQVLRGEATLASLCVSALFIATGGMGKALGGLKRLAIAGKWGGLAGAGRALERMNPLKKLGENVVSKFTPLAQATKFETKLINGQGLQVAVDESKKYGYGIIEKTLGDTAGSIQYTMQGHPEKASISIGPTFAKVSVGGSGSTFPGVTINNGLKSAPVTYAKL